MKKQNTKAPAGRAAPLRPATAGENSHALTSEGDTALTLTPDGVLAYSVDQAIQGKQEAEIAAIDAMLNGPPELSAGSNSIKVILDGLSPDDAALLRAALEARNGAVSPSYGAKDDRMPRRERAQAMTSDELADDWRRGYPYKYRVKANLARSCCQLNISVADQAAGLPLV